MPDDPSGQLQLPFEKLSDESPKLQPGLLSHSDDSNNVIQFEDAKKAFQDSERRDAIRRILTLREDIQEG